MAYLLTVTAKLAGDVDGPAVVSAKLVDADGEVLAGAAKESELPVDLVLDADPALVADASRLFLWAAARVDDTLWGTPDLVAVDGETVDVQLARIPD